MYRFAEGRTKRASMLPAPKGGSRNLIVQYSLASTSASMLPAPKGGSRIRFAVSAISGPNRLQCCPPRRAGVGYRHRAGYDLMTLASMLPAPKGGSRGRGRARTWRTLRCFNAARPEGRESGYHPPRHRLGQHASMLPAPKGGSRLVALSPAGCAYACFNAARPEGRESANDPRVHSATTE